MRYLPWEYGIRNLARSPLRTLLGVLGSTLVVLLVLAAGAFVRGMDKSLTQTAGRDNIILMSTGSQESVERSEISRTSPSRVAAGIPGIKQYFGEEYVSGEIVMMALLSATPEGEDKCQIVLRGVTRAAYLVHDGLRIVDGRPPRKGQDEMMLGRLAMSRLNVGMEKMAVGQKLWFDGRPWTISGHFEAPGTVLEAEVWMPLDDLQQASKRDGISSVVITLDSATKADVELFAAQQLDLELIAMPETEYYAKLSAFFKPIRMMVWITALLIAAGGLFGGLNTMYASFVGRVREIGSLQSLGYPRRAIVLSLLQESILTTAIGTLLATGIAIFTLDGMAVNFASGAFTLDIDSVVIAMAMTAGLLLGIIGTIPPAWRCLRMPIPVALKAS